MKNEMLNRQFMVDLKELLKDLFSDIIDIFHCLIFLKGFNDFIESVYLFGCLIKAHLKLIVLLFKNRSLFIRNNKLSIRLNKFLSENRN